MAAGRAHASKGKSVHGSPCTASARPPSQPLSRCQQGPLPCKLRPQPAKFRRCDRDLVHLGPEVTAGAPPARGLCGGKQHALECTGDGEAPSCTTCHACSPRALWAASTQVETLVLPVKVVDCGDCCHPGSGGSAGRCAAQVKPPDRLAPPRSPAPGRACLASEAHM